MASYKHRQNLIDLLNQIQVPTTRTSQDLNAMIGSINRELTISYSDKDLTKKGKHHNDPLHITVDSMRKRIPMVLVDDRSALNVYPLKTTSYLGQPWIHDTEAIPSSLYQKVWFPHEGAMMTIYRDALTVLKPIYDIDLKKEPLTLDGFEIEKPGFEKKGEEVEKIPMDFAPHGNNNVVAMIRKMNYLPAMNLGRAMNKPTTHSF